ncbi:MAG: hemin-degrading factor [Rhodospirillaceae bacterium]|nr:hemin-degrading factor [Rhodospirillaceae bacterium]
MTERLRNLAKGWVDLLAQEPSLRIRDAAKRLNATEAELVATRVGNGVQRLKGPWPEIIKVVPRLGEVMALTRNDQVVHERHGTYGELSVNGHVGLIVGDDIDLRIFFGPWRHGFAVSEETRSGPRQSLQFFDGAGQAVHKIYATNYTDKAGFDALVQLCRHENQDAGIEVVPAAAKPSPRPDSEIDAAALRTGWSELQDTHDFFGLLRKHKADREQAMRLAGPEFAMQVPNDTARRMLQSASASELPIMVFVGNPGMIQIHTGPVKKLVETGPWFNVLDPMFNLHLREDTIQTSWVVRKPTRDGVVTSIELFDRAGDLTVSFFGKRKPGIPEQLPWRELAESFARAA